MWCLSVVKGAQLSLLRAHPPTPIFFLRLQRYTKPTQARQQRERNATYMRAKTERVKLMEEMTLQSALWPW